MFLKRLLLSCVAGAILFSATTQAAPEAAPMPRVVPKARFDLVSFARAIHGLKLSFRADFANLQGQEFEVETRFCARNGDYLTFEKQQEIIYLERVRPNSNGDQRNVELRVSMDTIRQLYGTNAREIYVIRVIKDAATGAVLAQSQVFALPNTLPPQAPLVP